MNDNEAIKRAARLNDGILDVLQNGVFADDHALLLQALIGLRESEKVLREVLAEEPEDITARVNLGITLGNQFTARVYLEELDTARALYDEALPLLEEATREDPDQYGLDLARLYSSLETFFIHGDDEDSLACCNRVLDANRRRVALLEKLHARDPTSPEVTDQLAEALVQCVELAHTPERVATSVVVFQRSAALRLELAERRPAEPRFLARAAQIFDEFGVWLYRTASMPEEAIVAHERAIGLWRRVPPNTTTDFPGSHSDALATLAFMLATGPKEELRNGPRAASLAREALELGSSTDVFAIESLAAAGVECGDFDFAVRWQHRAVLLSSGEESRSARETLALYERGLPLRDSTV